MANGFGFPKYPQQKAPNPKKVGALLAAAGQNTGAPPEMLGGLPDDLHPLHPSRDLNGVGPSLSGMPVQPTANRSLSPFPGLKK